MIAWVDVGGARIAGRGGIGEGERPVRPGKAAALALREGDPAACEPEKDDRRELGRIDPSGGSIGVDWAPG